VAELRAVASARTTPRSIGGAKGRLTVPASFFEPLPDDLLDAFSGAPNDPQASGAGRPPKVAEERAPYGSEGSGGDRDDR
jgi:hypothetical protein